MDPNSLPNVISSVAGVVDAQNNAENDNSVVRDNTHIPAMESFVSQTPSDSQAQAQPQGQNDIHMHSGDDDDDDMPALLEVSDSSDSEADSDSDRDAHEVEMQTVDSNDDEDRVPDLLNVNIPSAAPGLSSTSIPLYAGIYESTRRPNSNRRARVDDDEDEERDRRHPSQRVSNANNNAAFATPSFPQAFAYLPQNQPQAQPNGASVPAGQTQRQTPHVHHHIFHATLNLPRRNSEPNNHPFRFFQHMMPNNNDGPPATQNNNNPNTTHNDNNNATTGAPQTSQQQQNGSNNGLPPQLFEGVAVSFEIGPGFRVPSGQNGPSQPAQAGEQAQENGQPSPSNQLPRPGTFADLMARFGILGQTVNAGGDLNGGVPININFGNLGLGLGMQQEKEDPERARNLIDGLEEVPVGLVRRLERVGGTGGGMGEDITNGGDAGCAICWDKLLDGDGDGFGKEVKAPSDQDDTQDIAFASLESQTKQPKIVSLPCAHVFHADCLIPWFSRPRHTTCPTCRFNIDPENLTFVSARRRQQEREQAEAARRAEDGVTSEEAQPSAPGEPTPNANPNVTTNNPDAPPFTSFLDFLSVPEAEMQENQFHELLDRMTARPTRPAGPAGVTPPAEPAPGAATVPVTPPLSTTIQTPQGPVNVIQVPIPLMIPVQVPAGPAAPGGVVVNQFAPPLAANSPGNTSAQPQPQPGPGGEFARLLSRITRQDPQQPAPFNSLFPLFRQYQTRQQQPEPAPLPANAGIAPTRAAVEGNLHPRVFTDPAIIGPPAPDNVDQPVSGHGNTTPTNQPAIDAPSNQLPPNPHAAEVMRFTFDMVFNGPLPSPAAFNLPPPATQIPAAEPQDQQAAGPERETTDEDFMMMLEGNTGLDQHLPRMRNLDEVLELLAADEREEQAERDANRNHAGGDVNQEAQPRAQSAQTTAPPPQRLPQFATPFMPGVNLGNGVHFASGSGRTVSEAFSQLFAGMRPQPQPQPQPHVQHVFDGQSQTEAHPRQESPRPNAQHQHEPPSAMGALPIPDMRMFPNLAAIFGGSFQEQQDRPKRPWTLPPAPGPTLRQRIERREREAGLRCYDVSCGIGPSDDDPFGSDLASAASEVKQLTIKSKENRCEICLHTFHSACLVSAERVSLRGADAIVEDGQVEVSCPVCRGVGCVSTQEWEEGVDALA